jgi:putative tricarboxylic transport membrane protein
MVPNPEKDSVRRSDAIFGAALLGLALAILLGASQLPFGRLNSPQPGFFPLILAVLLAVFSLPLLAQAREDRSGAFLAPKNWKRIGFTTGALLVFALLFERLGYILSTFIFMAFLLRAVEGHGWWSIVTVAFATSLACYLIFGLLLNTPLPLGILSF